MYYYSHHIGDYRKDTGHLTLLEHGIYRQLLDTYYLEEHPLTSDINKLMRSHSIRNADEQQSLQNVLNDFFELTDKGYVHARCEKELVHLYAKSESARASANARWARKNKGKDANAMQTQSEGNANDMLPINPINPIPINPLPNINTKTPEGVSDEVFNDFIKLRKGLKAPVTQTAIKGLTREAQKANLTLEQVLILCCQNGWRGFKAEWIKDKKTVEERNSSVMSGLTRGITGGKDVRLLAK
jgi:uncharacterized protein YdaU (DUF1376 family)